MIQILKLFCNMKTLEESTSNIYVEKKIRTVSLGFIDFFFLQHASCKM